MRMKTAMDSLELRDTPAFARIGSAIRLLPACL
jgi:hypothetical protein